MRSCKVLSSDGEGTLMKIWRVALLVAIVLPACGKAKKPEPPTPTPMPKVPVIPRREGALLLPGERYEVQLELRKRGTQKIEGVARPFYEEAAFQGMRGRTRYILVSADAVDFAPVLIAEA